MKNVWSWLKTVKAPLGFVVGTFAAGLISQGHTEAGAFLGVVAGWLHGAGAASSDREQKARQ